MRTRRWLRKKKTNGELFEGTSVLNVGKGGLELLELDVNLRLGLLGLGNGLCLEGLDGLNMGVDVVCHGLEVCQEFFGLVDDGLVLEDGAVVGKVYGGGLGGILLLQSLCL